MKTIITKSWNGTWFYYDQTNGKYIQHNIADLSNIDFNCDESDLDAAKDKAIKEGLTSYPIKLIDIELDEI
jgi:hypothetical protein